MPNVERKANNKSELGPIPPWAWGYGVSGVMIPVVAIGGAIPTALGFGAAAYCLYSSRETVKSTRFRMIRCSAVTAGSWIAYFLMAAFFLSFGPDPSGTGHVSRANQPITTQAASTIIEEKTDLADESVRREIYAKATRMIDSLDDAEDRLRESRRKGRRTSVPEKQVDHIKGMYEKDLEFTMNWYDITRPQLDQVLAEGDRKGWTRN